MNRLAILAVLLISGCIIQEEKGIDCSKSTNPEHKDIAMYGDSICAACGSSADILSIEKQCKSGRRLIDVDYIDSKYSVVFLALGINDIGQNVPHSDYSHHLKYLLGTTSARVICIMPNHHPSIESSLHREAIELACDEYIDPVKDCGVRIENPDGVHYSGRDQKLLAKCLNSLLHTS